MHKPPLGKCVNNVECINDCNIGTFDPPPTNTTSFISFDDDMLFEFDEFALFIACFIIDIASLQNDFIKLLNKSCDNIIF